MSLIEYKLTLRTDFNTPDKDKIIKAAVFEKARELLATASLIVDKRKSQIAVEIGDLFVASSEVDILEMPIEDEA